jgi:hypothetical protein
VYQIKIVEGGLDVPTLRDREEDHILRWGRADLGTGPLVNDGPGGEGLIDGRYSRLIPHSIYLSYLNKQNIPVD